MEESAGYNCMNCNKTYEDCNPTYNFSAKLQDFTGEAFVQFMGEIGETVLTLPATDFLNIRKN